MESKATQQDSQAKVVKDLSLMVQAAKARAKESDAALAIRAVTW